MLKTARRAALFKDALVAVYLSLFCLHWRMRKWIFSQHHFFYETLGSCVVFHAENSQKGCFLMQCSGCSISQYIWCISKHNIRNVFSLQIFLFLPWNLRIRISFSCWKQPEGVRFAVYRSISGVWYQIGATLFCHVVFFQL